MSSQNDKDNKVTPELYRYVKKVNLIRAYYDSSPSSTHALSDGSPCKMKFNSNHSLDRLLEFEQPLENQVIHIDPTQEEPSHLHLICRLSHVERHAQIIWSYNNSHKLPFAQFNTSFDGKIARLSAKDLKTEYSGSYACEIRLPCGASTAYTQCEVFILRRPQYDSNDTSHPLGIPVPLYQESRSDRTKSQESASSQCSRCEYAPPGMAPLRCLNQREVLRVSTVPPHTPPPPAPPPPLLPPTHLVRRQMEDAATDYDDDDTLPTDNYLTRGNAQRNHSIGRNQHYHSISTRSDCVSLTPAEYIELRTLSDVPGMPEDEQLEEVDVACECTRRTQSRNCGCTWRGRGSPPYPLSSFAEPRVIFINTAPQSDMVCPRCCCVCHRSHCMYVGAESYPLVSEIAHLSRGSFSKSSSDKRGNRRISFNPDPEMCYDEGARYERVRLDSMHISEGPSADLIKEPAQQTQAVSCSRITQHATVKPPPNCRPDASWTSGPGKYLPKDTEIQSPEAAAAARATIERVLESRMYDSVFGKSLDTRENKKVSKRAPTFPVSDPKPTKNKASKEEAIPGSNEDSSSSLVRAAMSVDGGEAAKERFLNALARFQTGTAPKPGGESNKAVTDQGSHYRADKPLKYSEDTNHEQKQSKGQTVQPWRKSFENAKTFLQTNQECKSSSGDHSLQQHHIHSLEHSQGT
eukprot:TsM_001030800 transcript=TsM_001030800 gene=TsM_001030800